MGQKVHPTGFRLGVIKDWKAHWYARKNEYAKVLQEDLMIRRYIDQRLKDAAVANVVINRAADRLGIEIYTARPGLVIGKKGAEVEQLRREIMTLTGRQEVSINVHEVKIPEIEAKLVAESIASKIEQRVNHRRAMKRAVEMAIKMGAKGIRVQAKGRLGGAEIARAEWYRKGRVPLQTIRADVDFARATAFTKYGTIGVKVWIYKGDVLGKREEEEEEVY